MNIVKTTYGIYSHSQRGFISQTGLQRGVFTSDLMQAKTYDNHQTAANMLKGYQKCWKIGHDATVVEIRINANVRQSW